MIGRPVGVLVMAYGTPRNTAEIEPYYTDIRRGRPPSAEQLADLTGRYAAIGGLSPAARAHRGAARRDRRRARGAGARAVRGRARAASHAAPSIERGVDALAARGVRPDRRPGARPALLDDVGGDVSRAGARAAAARGIGVRRDRAMGSARPAYVDFLAGARARRRWRRCRPNTKVVFTAHSLPTRILDTGDPYPHEVRATASAVAVAAGLGRWSGWSVGVAIGRTHRRGVARARHPRGHRRPRAGRARRRAAGLPVRVRGRSPRGALRPRRPGPPARRGGRSGVRPHRRRERRPRRDGARWPPARSPAT